MTAHVPAARWRFWVAAAVVFLLVLWLLNDILLPFVVGAVIAYFFDPVVVRLHRAGLSRTWATATVTVLAAVIAIGTAMAIVPPLFGQIEGLIAKAPQYTVQAVARVQPMIEPLRTKLGLPPLSLQELQSEAAQWAGQALGLVGAIASLRDWPKVLAGIDGALPLDHADTIRTVAHEANAAVAGYVRGQALVCLCLGSIYGIGLSLVGLQFGFVIGLIAGLISFIPFVGTLVGATLALGMALAQFPPDWISVIKVAVVFLIGHLLEGNVLSPKLVGDRVGLHPVWIMFALLAGGSLFGFVGVLVAVPVAAVIGVVARHLIGRYRQSAIYRGENAG